MKSAAIVSVVLLILSIIGVGYLYLTTSITIVDTPQVIAVEAYTQPELFQQLQAQVESGSVLGSTYTSSRQLEGAENYQFLTYTVRLRNNCYVNADMVEVQVTPMDGDVLQLGDFVPKTLPAQATGDIQATILTRLGMHPVRELNVTYYIWGLPFHLRTVYGQ